MKEWTLAPLGALVVLVSGCATQTGNAPTAPALGAEWQCLATASDLDAPGAILRRDDRNGALFSTIDLSKEIGIKPNEVAVGPLTSQFVTRLGLAADLLKLGKGVTETASAKPPKTYNVRAEYKDAWKQVTSVADADRATKWFATYSARETGFTYFLIRETVIAKDLTYILSPDLIADLGGESTLRQQVTAVSLPAEQRKAAPATGEQYSVPLSPQGDARLEVTKTTAEVRQQPYVLQMSFEKPLHVCFKAERLVQTASGADGSAIYDLVPVEASLEISSYKSVR